MALNPKQRKFAREFAKTGKKQKSAIKAGYSKKTAHVQATDLLKKPEIAAQVEKILAKQDEKAALTAADVLSEIRKLAFVDLTQAYNTDGSLKPMHEMPEDVRKAMLGFETRTTGKGKTVIKKFKSVDKTRSLEMLAKHFKLLTDVQEITGKDGGPQVILTLPANGSEAAPAVPPVETAEKK